ncbi:TonB-dependent receptor plug domain-containing protein [Flavobacterium chungangense]|uniref:Uncharacterized protein n=1 Tax=Flavobacterium chungangense TaxID=554283 RepID=A0A6V6Z4C9_9FLAO|nr:TonB-dependent receptor plug domain-containing protein [Flavobacterium chungangense]CAD0006603.1 hypothetical protein FLACHUCJ7_02939 [Flavobacterium chungangense]
MKIFKIIISLIIGVLATPLKAQTTHLQETINQAKVLYTQLCTQEKNPLFTVDGIILKHSEEVLSIINAQDIEQMNVLKDNQAKDKYGDKAVNGVIEITLKKSAKKKYKKLLKENISDSKLNTNDYKISISGSISDERNQPVPKVVISNLTKREAYYSDSLGIYKINVAVNDYISFSKEKFETQKLKITNQTPSNIILKIQTASSKIKIKKPIIYLYPTEKTDISLSFNFNGKLLTTFPKYQDKWELTVYPDGKIFDKKTNRFYNSLFWDGIQNFPDEHYNYKTGFSVEKNNLVLFLTEKLETLGLNTFETNDFIQFWLPHLEQNKTNFIHFYVNSDYDIISKNTITPKPDTSIRVFMEFYGIDRSIEISEQHLPKIERKGFTLVEWGGSDVSEPVNKLKKLKL